LKKEAQPTLLKVADAIRNDPELLRRTYQVACFTDASPPGGGRFKDVWGVGFMRAREVLLFLTQPNDKGGGGLPAARWSAASYGDTDPLKANDTPENKQANRRCEIVMMPAAEETLDLKTVAE